MHCTDLSTLSVLVSVGVNILCERGRLYTTFAYHVISVLCTASESVRINYWVRGDLTLPSIICNEQ